MSRIGQSRGRPTGNGGSITFSMRGRWAGSAPRFVRRRAVRSAFGAGAVPLGGVTGGLDLLGLLQAEEKLVLGQALGASSEAVTLHGFDDPTQALVLSPLLGEQHLERLGTVGRRSRHEAS